MEQTERIWGVHERFDVRVTPRYLNDGTSSREELLRASVGREAVKDDGLRVIIIYLLFWALTVRWREESQEDINEMSDWTEASEDEEQMG